MQNRFGTTSSYTVGVEEEFQLVAPSTLQLTPAVEDVIGASPDGSEGLAQELFQDCLEMRTPVFSTVAELARDLPTLRRHAAKAAKGAGVRIAASGLHPISDPFSQRFTRGERYKRMKEELGALARLQIIYALHVHVAVADEERAIRATNALLRHVPLFVALSANSPFWNGMDTGFASARVKIRDASPRSGLPPTFRSWEEFEGYTEALVATADDYAPQDARYVSENKWRAIRRGLDARLYDFDTREEKGARETARDLVARLRPVSQDLGCEAELDGVLEILERGSGAELQRAAYEKRGSLEDVIDYLLEATAPE